MASHAFGRGYNGQPDPQGHAIIMGMEKLTRVYVGLMKKFISLYFTLPVFCVSNQNNSQTISRQ